LPVAADMVNALGTLLQPWSTWYGGATWLSAGTTVLHLTGMFLGGGFAIAADRATLRALRRPKLLGPQLDELEAVYDPVILGLGVTLVTGVIMLSADWNAMMGSSVFLAKMSVILLLTVNGWWLRHASRRLKRASDRELGRWRRRLGDAARISGALWLAALVLGAVLPSL
jgi:hypothetical protein